jgi:hypothetical protein
MRGRQQAPPIVAPALPRIPGYEVTWGRIMLHARYAGTVAQAHQEGRPWHVVARDPAGLLSQIHHTTDTGDDR